MKAIVYIQSIDPANLLLAVSGSINVIGGVSTNFTATVDATSAESINAGIAEQAIEALQSVGGPTLTSDDIIIIGGAISTAIPTQVAAIQDSVSTIQTLPTITTELQAMVATPAPSIAAPAPADTDTPAS